MGILTEKTDDGTRLSTGHGGCVVPNEDAHTIPLFDVSCSRWIHEKIGLQSWVVNGVWHRGQRRPTHR